jgi:4-hydroxybutyryl-CoA dehydratase/vinylacetyl-CoA-Delta-isomerase
MAEEADMLVGLAHLLAEENGLGRIPHIKDKLAEMILHATMVRAALEAAISNAEFTDEGYATPSELYTNAAKYYGSTNLSRMLNHIHDIAGGSVLTVPLSGDLDNPEIAPYLEKYMSTKPEGNGAYRTKLMQSARDITASGYAGTWQVRVLLGGGGLYAQKLVASHHYDVNRAKALALEATGLGAFNGTS